MRHLSRAIHRLLLGRGHEFFREPAPPRAVTVQPRGSVFLARLDFGHACYRAVVKRVPPGAEVDCPERLSQIHERIRARGPLLAASNPQILGHDADTHCTVMTYFEGRPLLTLLRGALRWPLRRPAGLVPALERAADVLAEIHRLPAADVGLCEPVRRNDYFLPDLEELWDRYLGRRAARLPSPRGLVGRLSDSFPGRTGAALLPTDAQPKNVLVADSGAVCFIDLDYSCGNPMQGLARFLVSMDRAGLRYVLTAPSARLDAWKRAFAAAYLRRAPAAGEDLVFFYPWALLRTVQRHDVARPWLRPLLTWYYGHCLERFLTNLARHSPEEARRAPAELFASL